MESSQHAEHVVFFPAPDGSPAFRRVPSLADAAQLVEHLRNVEGVHEVGVHRLSEVPLSFTPYYRVELPTESVAPPAPAVELAPKPEPVLLAEPVLETEPVPVPRPAAVADSLDESLAQLLASERPAEGLARQFTSVPREPTLSMVEPPPLAATQAETALVEALAEQAVPAPEPLEQEQELAAAGSTVLPAEHHRSRGLGFFSS